MSFRFITYDEVRVAAEKLSAAGTSLSAQNLRVELGGRGSNSTILKHLAQWREQQPDPTDPGTVGIAEHLLQLLAKEVGRLAAERTAVLEASLRDTRGSVNELITESERLQEEAVQHEGELQHVQQLNAQQAGVERELRSQLKDALEQLADARGRAELARQESSLTGERLAGSEQRCARLDAAATSAAEEIQSLREGLNAALADAAAARSDARAVTVELASKSEVEKASADTLKQLQETQRQLEGARERLSALEAEKGGLNTRVSELKEALARSEAHVHALVQGVLAGAPGAESVAPDKKTARAGK